MKPLQQGNSTKETKPTGQFHVSGAGATWRRLDLHLHSPNVEGFVCPDGAARDFSDAYVEQLAAQGISIGAITDYNGVNREWFEVTAAKATNRGIILFPGAEMAFREGKFALHVLAIFSGDTDLDNVNSFLQSLDKDPDHPVFDGEGVYRDIELNISLGDALKDLRSKFNCLLILPHPDQAKGFFKSLTAADAAKLLVEVRPDGIEQCPEEVKKSLQSVDILPPDFWDYLAWVEFSNPKRIQEIGTKRRADGTLRATYLKLSATNLDALRLALHDPETRLSIGRVPLAIHSRIRSMVVRGPGFLGNLNISWNEDLNVIIGGEGAGKSAILETLRYALAIPPYSDRSYREELVRHSLGSGGKVEVILDRPTGEGETRQYRVVRAWGEEPRTCEVGSEEPLAISPSDLLGPGSGPTIFGQREIYAVSGSEENRLALLDELIGEDVRKCSEALDEAMESLTSNTRAILDMQAKLAKREEYDRRLKIIEHDIEIHKRHVTEKLKEAADLRGVGQALQNTTNVVMGTYADCKKIGPTLLAPLETVHRNLLQAESKHEATLQEAATVLAILQESLKVVLDDGKTLFEQALRSLNRLGARWQEKLRPLEQESKGTGQQTEAGSQDPLLRLTEERTSLASLMAELNGIEDRLKILSEKRQELLTHVGGCRHMQNKLRRERVAAITKALNGRLHLEVEFKGQKAGYKEQLSSLLKGSNISQDAINGLVTPDATDGIALVDAVLAGTKEVQTRFRVKPEMADLLVTWLTAEESRLLELATLIPQDALRVKLRIGDEYRSLEQLSAGQAATAIFLLLLGLQGRVLVIDQPEDYLDDRSSYEEIIQILRDQKGVKDESQRRQIIVATNDANIPVMSDAEIVIPLEARQDHAYIIGGTSIDDRSTRELIKTIMEGGEEAFERRTEKYGGLHPS